MSGAERKLIPTEGVEQASLFNWAAMRRGKYPELELMFHVPNEGKRSSVTGGRMVKEGMKAGVPDIFLPVPRGENHGLFIEMKRRKFGKLSKEQADWMEKLSGKGYACAVCFGWQAAAETIEAYLNGAEIKFSREKEAAE
nr:MAG TPA: Nuclease [Caudoviricetes sp.]